MEKLSAYLVPGESTWILKIVQAAVLSGSSSIAVQQTSRETDIRFYPQRVWSLPGLEEALLDPEVNSDPSLEHLKAGLWNVSFHQGRPFRCSLGGSQALVWTGVGFHLAPAIAREGIQLTISHRTHGLPLLRNLEVASINAGVARELSTRAFTCPVPLNLDARRLDSLQASPTHGYPGVPFRIMLAQTEDPVLPLPRATRARPEKRVDHHLSDLLSIQEGTGGSGLCLLSFFAHHFKGWTFEEKPHQFCWVRHGVVVDSQEIDWLPRSAFSCAVFASAEGLRSDLTGFSVIEDDLALLRRQRVLAALKPCFAGLSISLESLITNGRQVTVAAGSMGLLAGFLLSLVEPMAGGLTLAGGVAAMVAGGKTELGVEKRLQEDLEKLRQGWKWRG